ncbi:rhomboid family intramembrane serine protease [Pseudooceanicola sediminis]|uniref:Rhomboid family intramembrane serine protease n=1 Tax=Pseudooceanicola sediminis TaxID=2211117 RepID=A0A399IZH0_9RHOB|nr:rhomboid family intramembrane serine protease [Pseudooceanicola sediminis]KAA2313201.1 rhomboid family intramembrane serine protease [Puniceibacterium sp. HSS470]RII37847.1 rhomboid family intramembrane serine protease [Pseudooceanicola sediminis]|tara:strand:- start:65482 stop:66249 length:768 start_codon:yes stop_codon:yes gene_type:complete
MFPLRDHNPSLGRPLVTYALIFLNILVFFYYVGPFQDPRSIQTIFARHAMIPANITAGEAPLTLITSMFLHGGMLHLAGNMLFLWIFGDNLEDEMGHLGFLGFYLAAGVGAGLAQALAAPASTVPTVGASGAIAGVLGGYLLLFPRARVDILVILLVFFRSITVPAWIMLGLWFALQLFNGLGSDPTTGGVAYWAHAGGFLLGLVLTLPLFVRRGGPRFWSRHHGKPPHPDAAYRVSRSHIPCVPRNKQDQRRQD